MFCDFKYSEFISEIFNNNFFIAIISILLTSFLTLCLYRRQKKLDRLYKKKDLIINEIISLKERTDYCWLIINKIFNTRKKLLDQKECHALSNDNFFAKDFENLSLVINDEIPQLDKKIYGKINVYFKNNNKLKNKLKNFRKKLKEWHDLVINKEIYAKKMINEKEEILFKEVHKTIDELVDFIEKEIK